MKQEPEIPLDSTWHYVELIPGDVDSIYDACDTLGPWHTLNHSERLLALKELNWEGVSPEDKQRIINRETVDVSKVSVAGQPPSSSGGLAGGADEEKPSKGTYQVWHDTSWPHSRITHRSRRSEPRFPDDYTHVAKVEAESLGEAVRLTTDAGNARSSEAALWENNEGVQALVTTPRDTAAGDVIVDPNGKAHRFGGKGFDAISPKPRTRESSRQSAPDNIPAADVEASRYVGYRSEHGAVVLREGQHGRTVPLPMRNDLRNHSPSGPEWGYGGSGPAQLALAILSDAIGERAALLHYQEFKFAVICGLPHEIWELRRDDVLAWYQKNRPSDAEKEIKARTEVDQLVPSSGKGEPGRNGPGSRRGRGKGRGR
jgi:hypothetical protein